MAQKEEKNIALYRKYRPENFDEVIGQDHIVKAVTGSLASGKVAHAYLLSGPRGTGKTTIARIIARELGTSVNDIYEMDAASNRKIEDARDIRESVRTLPFDSKYKVYILDEVHMLTKEAWNALLKTIEEPPEHVIFILATTELDKVPETIISRCQTFTLKKPSDAVLSKVAVSVAKKEGYTIEEGGGELIALLGGGSFRDTLGIVQKVIAFAKGKKITATDIEEVTGAPGSNLVDGFIVALAEANMEKGFSAIRKASEQNIDMKVYLEMILAKLRAALMLRYVPDMKGTLSETLSEKDMTFLSTLVKEKPEHISSFALTRLLGAYQEIGRSAIAALPIELALVDILTPR